jgi:hypothetical protein
MAAILGNSELPGVGLSDGPPISIGALRWCAALAGLGIFVSAIIALSGPGRIDILDGEARYLTARSLVDHGDPIVRDDKFWFSVFPGRDGKRYSNYRFPHILAGIPAILLADATGPVSETRREFFFTQVGAVVGGLLAVLYAIWFRSQGHAPIMAVGWALAGIFCTPSWYYATSTFDEILGTLFVVAAVGLAWWSGRGARPLTGAALAGLALGLAFNSKQPLAVFVLPMLALVLSTPRSWRTRAGSAAIILGGLALGIAAYKSYETYRFPPGTTDAHAQILKAYLQPWPGDTLAGLCGLLLSPAAGVFWYCPPLLLALFGLVQWRRREPVFCTTVAIACLAFVVFISTMSFFKGDPCWGPRYLTPIFALLWLFAPAAASAWPRRLTLGLLGLGLMVQLLGLSVDPFRLYVYHRLPSAYYGGQEWIHFEPALGHLVNRPREILEIWQDDGASTTAFCADPLPTSTTLLMEEMERGPETVRKYRYLASFRPWWNSQSWLAPPDRPVALIPTVQLLLGASTLGLGLLAAAVCLHGRRNRRRT